MKKGAVFAGLLVALFVGTAATAHAGTHYSFGFSVGVGPTIPFGYYAYPAYPYPDYPPYYSGYYVYPYNYYYSPYYRTYAAPRYYAPPRYENRYYRHDNGNRGGREGRSNSRSRMGRGR
jgi:hypothetical protein